MSRSPVATLVTVATVLLALLGALAGTGVLSGRAAAWVAGAIGVLNLALGLYARSRVTPLADPRDAQGRPLTP